MENTIEPTLDDALNTFVEENDRPTAENLQEWVDRYPQFRRDLVEFAAVWAEQIVLPRAAEMGADAEKVLVDRAMSYVLNVAYGRAVKAKEQLENDDPIPSLTGAAQRAGIGPLQLAKACRLDLGLLSKLNRRQIKVATIPIALVRLLGQQLHKSTPAVRAYLAGTPLIGEGKAFLATSKPIRMGQQSFVDAVRSSSLDEADKIYWLKEGTADEI